jgi:hypothetical protein
MKKFVAVIAIALVVAAAVWVSVRYRLSHRQMTVPELLPADTLLLVTAPDLNATRSTWHESQLCQIWKEPSVQTWLGSRFGQFSPQSRGDEATEKFFQLHPTHAFVALTAIENNEPRFLGGFHFEGTPEAARQFIEGRLSRWWPKTTNAGRETVIYQQHPIESVHTGGLHFVSVYDRQWFFAASDLPALKALLDRADRRTEKVQATLNRNQAFIDATKLLPAEYGAMLYVDPQPFLKRLLPVITMTGQSLPPSQLERLKSIRSIATTLGFNHGKMHETDFVAMPRIAPELKLTRTLLPAADADTFFYSCSRMRWPDELFSPTAPAASGLAALLGQCTSTFRAHGIGRQDLGAAFGNEVEIVGEWPTGAHWPSALVALPVADRGKAQKAVDVLTAGDLAGETWQRTEKGGATIYTAQPFAGIVPLTLTLAISDRMFFAGTNQPMVEAAMTTIGRAAGELQKSANFLEASAQVPAGDTGFSYIDTKLLFDRLDAAIRPLLVMGATIYPTLGKMVDVANLPQAEAVTKHLSPIVMSQRYQGGGYLSESVGTVSFRGATLGAAAAVGVTVFSLRDALENSGLLKKNLPNPFSPSGAAGPSPTPSSSSGSPSTSPTPGLQPSAVTFPSPGPI